MLKSVYNAIYLAIFIRFCRLLVAKYTYLRPGKSKLFSLYLADIERENRTFALHICTSSDISLILTVQDRLLDKMWETTILRSDERRPWMDTYPVYELRYIDRNMMSKSDIEEIAGALDGLDMSKVYTVRQSK